MRNKAIERAMALAGLTSIDGAHVGFTGSRSVERGSLRFGAFAYLADSIGGCVFHSGCAVGWDRWAVHIVASKARHVFHPCSADGFRWADALIWQHVVRGISPPLVRNRAIVSESHFLIACPAGMSEERRSGTRATIRYARKAHRPVVIVWPDGIVTVEDNT